MPAISVCIDGVPLVCIASSGLDLIDVQISATQLGPVQASLEVHGGGHPSGEESQFLIWVSELSLKPGQCVSVAFLETGETSRRGKTI